MARNSFNARTGGLVNTVVSNVATSVGSAAVTSIGNIGNPNPASGGFASFSVNTLLADTIKTTSGIALNAGENYLTSQLQRALPRGENAAILNSVVTQVASAGIKQISNFASQSIGGLFGGLGDNVTTAGLGAQASRSSKSIPDSVASKLPQADYGGQTYTLENIVFTLVPANAGAQTAPQGQTSATLPTDVGYSAEAAASLAPIKELKGAVALAGPAKGINIAGKNFGANYALGSAPKVRGDLFAYDAPLRDNPLW